MVELSLVLATLLLTTLGLMDVARLLWTYNEIENAVDITARCGAIDQYSTCANPQTYFSSFLTMTSNTTIVINSNASCGVNPSGSSQIGNKVTATYRFDAIVWPLASTSIVITRCYAKSNWL
jgi:Flp pilus assembly protein TadG